ncbi:hypothetical protein A9Q81_08080 [Gammaproteobacteria bacterium 42_54_T18]|nr:hypothetical protein A9Q81_08080 [Gammaproteobacteria bacterium 42_54_T18]
MFSQNENVNKYTNIVELVLVGWLCLGLFLILSSMVWSLTGTAYITRIHIGWVLPSVLIAVWGWRYFLIFWVSNWSLMLFFVSIIVASAFLTENNEGITRDLKAVSILVFGMPALVRVIAVRNFLIFDVVLFFSGVIVCGYVLVELYDVYTLRNGRAVSRFEVFPQLNNPLYMAQYVGALGVLFLGAAGRISQNKGQLWPVFLVMFCILALAAFKTESRSWLVAMALVCIVAMYSTKRFGLMAAGLVSVVVLGWFFKDQIFARGISMSYRDQIWMEGIRQGMDRPLGQGSGASLRVLRWDEPHNIFLTMWLMYGLVPMLLFVSAVLVLINQVRVIAPREYFGWLLPLAFGVGMLFFEGANVIHRPNESWLLIWIPICFLLAAKTYRYVGNDSKMGTR